MVIFAVTGTATFIKIAYGKAQPPLFGTPLDYRYECMYYRCPVTYADKSLSVCQNLKYVIRPEAANVHC
jgi:hypothetical protein